MKKNLYFLCLFLTMSFFGFAQSTQSKQNRVEALQIAFLTKEIELTADEAKVFWPVYNDYRKQIAAVRKSNRSDELEFEEKVLNIRKKYKSEFKKVLGSDQRVNKIFLTEKNFREILRKELQERKKARTVTFKFSKPDCATNLLLPAFA